MKHAWVLSFLVFITTGCVTMPPFSQDLAPPSSNDVLETQGKASASSLMDKANSSSSPLKEKYLLMAAKQYLQEMNASQAENILKSIDTTSLDPELITQKRLLYAQLDLSQNQPNDAIQKLQEVSPNIPKATTSDNEVEFHQLLAAAYARSGNALQSAQERLRLESSLTDDFLKTQNRRALWDGLIHLSPSDLQKIQSTPDLNPTLIAWAELALIVSTHQSDQTTMKNEVELWQKKYPNHPAYEMLSADVRPQEQFAQNTVLLLPLSGPQGNAGQAVRNGFVAAFYEHHSHDQTIKVFDTNRTDVLTLYQQAIHEGAKFIVGPMLKEEVDRLSQEKLSIPTLALNYSANPSVNQPNLYQFGLSTAQESEQAAAKIFSDGHQQTLAIVPNSAWGQKIYDSFKQSFEKKGGMIVDTLFFNPEQNLTTSIKHFLQVKDAKKKSHAKIKSDNADDSNEPSRRDDFDSIFLVGTPKDALMIVPLLKFYFAEDTSVYSISSIYAGVAQSQRDRDLDGLIFCETPYVLNHLSSTDTAAFPQLKNPSIGQPVQYVRLYALGMDAYQLSTHLGQIDTTFDNSLNGETGYLTFSDHTIHRQLSWVKMTNGTLKSD